ncbi:adenylate/guanylate cyclase domain-containing protein [Krasilnikovia sp. M28-CT-15]|uniref:adenylate/guanylate cyclase domain-containing protein n=1 Tax=Krasilnikovia sp. M28-CT-15 TaxID=3373540 RepID=UPI0038775967
MDVVQQHHLDHATGHRRDAAVLFADLSGFSRLVETVEPEIVYQVVQPLMDDLVDIARHHGGEIQQIMGDGFMCVFGLHATQGDEAERAVAAGLELVASGGARLGLPSVHAGVETGEIYVTGSWPPAGYGVWGRPVNLASRLCDLAGPGELQIGPHAFAQVRRLFGPVRAARTRLKGVTTPVLTRRISPQHLPQQAKAERSSGAPSRECCQRGHEMIDAA